MILHFNYTHTLQWRYFTQLNLGGLRKKEKHECSIKVAGEREYQNKTPKPAIKGRKTK